MLDFPHCISHLFILSSSATIFPSLCCQLILTQAFAYLEVMADSVTVLVQIAGNSNKSLASAFLSIHSHEYRELVGHFVQ